MDFAELSRQAIKYWAISGGWPGLIMSLLYLALGWGTAFWLERRHFQDIEQRERKLAHIHITMTDPKTNQAGMGAMHMGSAVVAHDLFRRLFIALKKVFGGNVRHYERLVERGRREAILRLKEQASASGASEIQNIRLQTTNIKSGGIVRAVEVLAYGTSVAS